MFLQNNVRCARSILFVIHAQKHRLSSVTTTQRMCFAHYHANHISFTNSNLLKRVQFAGAANPIRIWSKLSSRTHAFIWASVQFNVCKLWSYRFYWRKDFSLIFSKPIKNKTDIELWLIIRQQYLFWMYFFCMCVCFKLNLKSI